MSLKYRLLTQSILVLISTIVITCCAGFAYVYFYNLLNNTSAADGLGETDIIVIENDNVIYKSKNFSNIQVKEMLMNISIKKNRYDYGSKKYSLKSETFTAKNNAEYKIIKLSPIIDLGVYYKSLLVFVILIFLITFILASIIVQRQNLKNIIIPIIDLKKGTEKLRIGELEAAIKDEGYDEVRELGSSIEQLRLKLKNSIYYQQKFDENRKFLISSISHDLKTPVTSIRGYIDGVLDGIADTDEKKQEYLRKAVDKTKLINIMIEDLLLYSKLDLNQIPFKMEKTDILKYIEHCVEDNLAEFECKNKNIVIENELSGIAFANIDRERFKRVVQNIVDNAKKNIGEYSGRLTIKLRETNSSIILEFKDNGKGIEQDDLPYIFERFYRADSARAIEGSSGLGLAIAKQIVEGLGGRIWAISKVDEGTSIIISLKKSS